MSPTHDEDSSRRTPIKSKLLSDAIPAWICPKCGHRIFVSQRAHDYLCAIYQKRMKAIAEGKEVYEKIRNPRY